MDTPEHTYELSEEVGIKPVFNNVLVKRVDRTSEYESDGGIHIPEDWVDKSPNQAKYGIILDWGDIDEEAYKKVYKDHKNKAPEKTHVTKKILDREICPCEWVAAFSRGRHLPVKSHSDLSFVKMANLLWVEPYDPEVFGEFSK